MNCSRNTDARRSARTGRKRRGNQTKNGFTREGTIAHRTSTAGTGAGVGVRSRTERQISWLTRKAAEIGIQASRLVDVR